MHGATGLEAPDSRSPSPRRPARGGGRRSAKGRGAETERDVACTHAVGYGRCGGSRYSWTRYGGSRTGITRVSCSDPLWGEPPRGGAAWHRNTYVVFLGTELGLVWATDRRSYCSLGADSSLFWATDRQLFVSLSTQTRARWRERGTIRQAADRELEKTFIRRDRESEERSNRRPMEMGRFSLLLGVGRLPP